MSWRLSPGENPGWQHGEWRMRDSPWASGFSGGLAADGKATEQSIQSGLCHGGVDVSNTHSSIANEELDGVDLGQSKTRRDVRKEWSWWEDEGRPEPVRRLVVRFVLL